MRSAHLYVVCVAAALAASACQGSNKHDSPSPSAEPTRESSATNPVSVLATRRADNVTIADVRADTPCRATISGTDYIVGYEPFVMMVGDVRYEGAAANGSFVFTRNGGQFARVMATDKELSVFDEHGRGMFRATVDDGIVRSGGGSPVAQMRRDGEATIVSSSAGDIVVTGPADLLLAAVVTATEASPEVRALVACHRLQKAAI